MGLLLCIFAAASLSLANGIPKLSFAEAWGILWRRGGGAPDAAVRPRAARSQGGARHPQRGRAGDGGGDDAGRPEKSAGGPGAAGRGPPGPPLPWPSSPSSRSRCSWCSIPGRRLRAACSRGPVVIIAARGARSPLQVVLVGGRGDGRSSMRASSPSSAWPGPAGRSSSCSSSCWAAWRTERGSTPGSSAPWVAVCLPLGLLLARPLNTLRLGRRCGRGRWGMSVGRVRTLVLLLGAGLVGRGGGRRRPHRVDRTPRAASDPSSPAQRGPAQGARLLRAHGAAALLTMADVGAKLVIGPRGDARGAMDGGAGRAGPAPAAQGPGFSGAIISVTDGAGGRSGRARLGGPGDSSR